jgi:hypothetical protein
MAAALNATVVRNLCMLFPPNYTIRAVFDDTMRPQNSELESFGQTV